MDYFFTRVLPFTKKIRNIKSFVLVENGEEEKRGKRQWSQFFLTLVFPAVLIFWHKKFTKKVCKSNTSTLFKMVLL